MLNNSAPERNPYFIGGIIDIQSFLLLKAGLKPVIRIGCANYSESNLRELKQLLKGDGIQVLLGEFKGSFYNQKIKEPIYILYFSLSLDLVRQAYEAEKTGDRQILGRLLGYPSCCVKNFIEKAGQENYGFIIYALLKSHTRPSLYCNFIFNFDSKLDNEKEKIYQKTRDIWRRTAHFFLIKHTPCSFNCQESIKLGEKTLKLLKKETPKLGQEIEKVLQKPVLYFDDFRWLVFDGTVKGNQLEYSRVLSYQSLFPKEKLDLIKAGNRLVVCDKRISVFKNEKLVATIGKEDKYRGALIDFG